MSAGGKGVNVARVLALLGAKVRLAGFFAGNSGHFILDDLMKYGIDTKPVFIAGETRSSINIIEKDNARETEILEQGPKADRDDLDQMTEVISECLADREEGSCVVFSGGIPGGLGSDTYAKLIAKVSALGGKCFLDTSAEALMHGISAAPFFIKPNIREFSSVSGYALPSGDNIPESLRTGIAQAARSLGITAVAVTLSDKGAVLCTDAGSWFAHPIPVLPVNTIGSGDSFTAGFVYGTANNEGMRGSLELATACAASNALFERVGYIDPVQVGELRKQVLIEAF